MLDKIRSKFTRIVADQLRLPSEGLVGRLVARQFQRKTAFLENGAVKLLNIQPDDRVLEIGFGSGIGLRAAYSQVQNGKGVIYGIDRSHFMLHRARKYCALEMAEGKVQLNLALVSHLPYPDSFFDRLFHCNTYYYWNNLVLAAAELKRVMKPGATMVTTLSMDNLKRMTNDGLIQSANTDPLDYMHALDSVGFEGIQIKYMNGTDEEEKYQGIFAIKPLKEQISEETLEEEEEKFRQAMGDFEAAEMMKRSGRPVAPGFNPMAKDSKSASNSEEPAVEPK